MFKRNKNILSFREHKRNVMGIASANQQVKKKQNSWEKEFSSLLFSFIIL